MKDWRIDDPIRVEEETALMHERYPDFVYEIIDDKATWTGVVKLESIKGSLGYKPHYQALKIRIICDASYPNSFPKVEDVEQVLQGICPHYYRDKPQLCYSFGTRDATELDFVSRHRVADLYPVMQSFLLQQSLYIDGVEWPDGQHHLNHAFLWDEFNNGCIDPNSLCPCMWHGKSYADCHLPEVESAIKQFNQRMAKSFGERKFGANSRCPCGSGSKFKRCCRYKNYFGVERKHFITLYPELSRELMEEIMVDCDEEIERAVGLRV